MTPAWLRDRPHELLIGGLVALVATAAALVHPAAPLALAGVAWFVMLGAAGPMPFLLVFLVVLLLRPGDLIPELADLQLAKWGALAAVALAVSGKLLRRDLSWVRAPQNGLMLWLTVAVLVSTFRGSDPAYSQTVFQEVFVKVLIVYFLIVNLAVTPGRALAVQITVAVCTAVLGGYAIVLKFSGGAVIEGSRAAFVGLLGDPNDLALTLLMGIPFLVAGTLDSRGARRVALGVLAVLTVGGLLASQSRGGMLGLAVALFFLMRDRVRSQWFAAVAVAVMLGGALLAAGIGDRRTVEADTVGIDQSAQGRLDAWRAGAMMFRAHPFIGVGFETFMYQYPSYAANAVDWGPKETHNSWIKALAETGLFGFVPFCLLLGVSARMAWRLRGLPGPPGLARTQRQTLFATFSGVLVAAFFLSQTWNWFLYILVGLSAATMGATRVANRAAAAKLEAARTGSR